MRLFTFCHQILSILTIGANIGSCPRTTPPSPTAFFHFAPLSRVATSFWARAIVFIICGHFDHGCLESPARSHCVYMYLQRRGKTRNEMVIPDQSWKKGPQVISSGLKCFRSRSAGERTWNPGLQVKASVQAIDARARISPWTSFRNRFRWAIPYLFTASSGQAWIDM